MSTFRIVAQSDPDRVHWTAWLLGYPHLTCSSDEPLDAARLLIDNTVTSLCEVRVEEDKDARQQCRREYVFGSDSLISVPGGFNVPLLGGPMDGAVHSLPLHPEEWRERNPLFRLEVNHLRLAGFESSRQFVYRLQRLSNGWRYELNYAGSTTGDFGAHDDLTA